MTGRFALAKSAMCQATAATRNATPPQTAAGMFPKEAAAPTSPAPPKAAIMASADMGHASQRGMKAENRPTRSLEVAMATGYSPAPGRYAAAP